MAEFKEKELSGNILEDMRKQILPLSGKELDRVMVATERMSVLARRTENFTAQMAKLDEEIADLKAKVADVDACEAPGALNRQIVGKESERAGLEERIESLSQGGDVFLAAKKELEAAKADLQRAIHRAINSIREKYEEKFNDLLAEAWIFYQAWKSAADNLYYENGSHNPHIYSLFIDRKRSDLIIRGQY